MLIKSLHSLFCLRKLRMFAFLGTLFLLTQQGCRCCPNSFIASQAEGTLLVTLGSTDATPVQFDISTLRANFKVEACYGRVVLRRVQLVFDPSVPNNPNNLEMTTAEIMANLRLKNYVEIPSIRLPLTFETCSQQDPQNPTSYRCFLSSNPSEKTQDSQPLELGDPNQFPPQTTLNWKRACAVATAAEKGLAKKPVLLLFAGFLEDIESSYTVPPQSGKFTFQCK